MLDSLHIKNFRCFEDLTIPSLGRVNLIVGKNNSGKSTLLEAMYIFSNRGGLRAITDVLSHRGEFDVVQGYTIARLLFNGNKNIINGDGFYIGNDQDNVSLVYLHPSLSKEKMSSLDESTLFSVISSDSELKDFFISLKDSGFGVFDKRTIYQHNMLGTNLIKEDYLASMWDGLLLSGNDEKIKDYLKILNHSISQIFFIGSREKDNKIGYERTAIVKLTDPDVSVPLRSLGEGTTRLFQLFLSAFQARGGYLMIDEFENGLHYSIQEEIWEKLFELAKALDIQVFATTHSQDTLRAFGHVALRSPEEGKIISLARHTRDNDPKKGQISALVYDENDIEMILQTNMEVR